MAVETYQRESNVSIAGVDRVLTVASLSILVGFLASALLLWLEPFSDSIDVIGLPLILDYSESTERQLITVFAVGSFVSASLLFKLIAFFDRSGWRRPCDLFCAGVGTVGLAGWGVLPIWNRVETATVIWIAGVLVMILLARIVPRIRSFEGAWSLGTATAIAFIVATQMVLDAQTHSLSLPILAFVVAVILEMAIRGFRVSIDDVIHSVIRWLIVLALLVTSVADPAIAIFTLLTAFVFFSSRMVVAWSVGERCLVVMAFVLGMIWLPQIVVIHLIETLILGFFLGWGAEFAFQKSIDQHRFADLATRTAPLLVLISINLLYHSAGPFVWLLAASLLVILVARLRSRVVQIPLVLFLLATCFLNLDASMVSRAVDRLHDGQIVSAVWQWKQGQTLFDEVFPLRLTEFLYFAALDPWVGDSRENYIIAYQFLDLFGPLGLFVLVLGITGDTPWSWITALLVGSFLPADYRAGTCMLLLGVAAYLLRSSAIRIGPLSLVGFVSMWLGYDAWGAVMGATGAAILVTSPGTSKMQTLLTQIRSFSLYVLTAVGLFVVSLALWQGWPAVSSYFKLFVEYAREYPAFYGFPLQRSLIGLNDTVTFMGILLGSGIAILVPSWRDLSLTHRRHVVLLIVASMVFVQRALGRSDPPHLVTLWYPIAVLISVGLYWLIEFITRHDIRINSIRPHFMTTFVIIACYFYHGVPFPPVTWFQASSRLNHHQWPSQREEIASRLGPHDSLWEIQYGMWSFTYRRINPTRHSLAYCMGWPKETNRAVRAMEKYPPKVIEFRTDYQIDHIPAVLWNPAITHFLYEHYRPVPANDFLEPSPDRWRGWSKEYEDYAISFKLRELPRRWGGSLDHFVSRIEQKQVIEPSFSATHDGDSLAVILRLDHVPAPRDQLLLRLNESSGVAEDPVVMIQFAGPDGDFDGASKIEFHGRRGVRDYLIPVGLNPAWSWRDHIKAIKVSIEAPTSFSIDRAEIWELRPAE